MNDFNHKMCKRVPGYKWCYWRWFYISRWAAAKTFEMKHGFDYRDVWSLDYSMSKWIAPRLRHLASVSCGSPHGYPLPDEEIMKLGFEAPTDFDAWRRDIDKAASFFEDLVKHENEDFREDWKEIEDDLRKRQSEVFAWMAIYFRALWD